MNQKIRYPIMNITEYIFDSERVYFSDTSWLAHRTFKERQLKRLNEWRIIDSKGKIYGVEIIDKEKLNNIFSFIFGDSYRLNLDLVDTNETYELRQLKDELLSNSKKMFHIYHNKLISLEEYETKLNNARSFREIIEIASFGDYKDKNAQERHESY